MSSTVSAHQLTFELPGEGWVDNSFHCFVYPDLSISCFVARDPLGPLDATLERRTKFVTRGASEVHVDGQRAGGLGPLESIEAQLLARESDRWVYYRIASARYYDEVLTVGVFGEQASRDRIDAHMDEVTSGIRLRRR